MLDMHAPGVKTVLSAHDRKRRRFHRLAAFLFSGSASDGMTCCRPLTPVWRFKLFHQLDRVDPTHHGWLYIAFQSDLETGARPASEEPLAVPPKPVAACRAATRAWAA